MTTEQKIQVLREDFLKRNGENYTSAERSGRLGWEQTLSSGSAYSAAWPLTCSTTRGSPSGRR